METFTEPYMTTGTNKIIAVRMKTPNSKLEELWQSVYIVGPEKNIGFNQMFARARCREAPTLSEADIVVFTGGSVDVHPEMYGTELDRSHESVYTAESVETMLEYIEVFNECLVTGTPMIGVCLGAQFLHVMNGGKLFQDVDGHNKPHPIWDIHEGRTIDHASSVHHQMCRHSDNFDFHVTAVSYESDIRWIDKGTYQDITKRTDEEDIEGFWYEDTACLGVQGHPEYSGYNEYTSWFINQVTQYIVNNPDLEIAEKSVMRLKKEIRDNREYKTPKTVEQFLKKYG